MQFKTLTAATALVGAVAAQRPNGTSICDYYTTALLKNNTAANQETLLILVVNTAVIGNYTQPNVGVSVPGILAKGTYNGTEVNLLPYFTGALASSNRGGSSGVSINFLDDGGAAPLKKNMPADGTTSAQYMLLTHLYQFFGALLGCSASGYPAYQGQASMYEVHKFMDLNPAQVGYFIEQVGLSAASFGVAKSDIEAVGTALTSLFDYRCAPATAVIPAQGPQLQSICTDETCPLAMNSNCTDQPNGVMPMAASSSSSTMPSGTGSSTPSGTSSVSTTGTSTNPPSVSSGAASLNGISFVAAAAGVVAALL